MRQRLLDVGAPLTAAALLGAAVGLVSVNDPTVPGRYPPCPVLTELGLHCPGCGGLRATHALAHGAWGAAWGANALVTAGALLLALALLGWLALALTGLAFTGARRRPDALPRWMSRPPRTLRRTLPPPVLAWGVGALVAAFTVLRNLPAGAFLTP